MSRQEFDFTFGNENGLHARPAGELVKQVNALTSSVTIEVPGLNKTAKADKLFTLMGLGVKQGETVKVIVEGEKSKDDVNILQKFLNDKFSR